MRIKLFSVLFLLHSGFSFGISNVKLLDRSSEEMQSEIINIKASLNSLDKKIEFENQSYLTRLKRQEKIQAQIDSLNIRLKKNKTNIYVLFKDLKKKVMANILFMESSEEIDSKLKYKLISRNLKKESEKLEKLLTENNQMEKMSGELMAEMKKVSTETRELHTILMDLEGRKGDLFQNMNSVLTAKKRSDARRLKRRLDRYVKAQINPNKFNLIAPVKSFYDVTKSPKGFHFFISENTNIISPAAGKVVYAGDLSTFGKVVMVEHQDQMRSVLLGKFIPEVSRGDSVKQGQKIGVLKVNRLSADEMKIYLELRKEDKAIKLAKYLDLTRYL